MADLNKDRARALAFGSVAELYDRARPSYPAAAVDYILGLVDSPRTVVEVGCGTGKATALLTARGLDVTAIEPHPAMAALAARNAPSATMVTTAFEDWGGPPAAVDLVVAAQSWHWVDPAVGNAKVAALLRPGGAFAVMANLPRDGAVDIADLLRPAYESVVPGLFDATGMLHWDGAMVEPPAPHFDVLEPWHVDWDDPIDAERYVELMQSHSEYPLLPPGTLTRLVDAVRTAVHESGGVVTMRYRTVVRAALRR